MLAAENDNQPAAGGSRQGRNVGVMTTSPTQLNAVDQPGTAENLTDTVTNESGSTQHLTFSGRTLGAYRSLFNTQFTLSDSDPQTPDYAGVPINYQRLRFRVPAGLDRIDASAAYHGATPTASLNARVRITLIDPNGTYVGDSRPQGLGNFGDLQIAHPAAGTWTAYVYSRDSDAGGYVGPVAFGVSGARYTSFGTVRPSSATLRPGQAVAVQIRTHTPAQPGDASGAIVVSSGGSGHGPATATTVPVTLRSLIPSGSQTFSGTITGGNGRAPISGQEFFYQLDVPAGRPELNATITVQDPGNQFGAYLIDPQGEAVAYATNMVPGATASSPPENQVGAQLHTLSPAPGRWRLAVVFAPVVSGNSLSSPFEVSVNQQAVPASGGTLPNAASTQLTAGQAYTYNVTVKNTGTAPETFFPDARLPGNTPFTLGAVSGNFGQPAGQRQPAGVPRADQLDTVPGTGDDERADAAPVRVPARRGRSGPGLDGRHHGIAVVREQPPDDGRVGRAADRVRDVRDDRATERGGHHVGERRHEPVRHRGQLADRRPGGGQREPGVEPGLVCAESPSARARPGRFRSRSRRAERRARRSRGRCTSTTRRTSSSVRFRTRW